MRIILFSFFVVLFLSGSVFPRTLRTILVHDNRLLSATRIIELCRLVPGMPVDSSHVHSAYHLLMRSGCFDTAMAQMVPVNDTVADIHIFVRELDKSRFSFYGASASLTMYGEDKLWFTLTPGYERRFLGGKPQSLLVTLTFPYSYGLYAGWNAVGCPTDLLNCGASVQARSTPYQLSRYYANDFNFNGFLERLLTSRLSLKLSAGYELSKTWRVDPEKWKQLDWQIVVWDPDEIRSEAFSAYYPRSEQVPSLALSLNYDKRDHSLYPTRGYCLFSEARRFWVQNLDRHLNSPYNQATFSAKGYLSPCHGQTLASHLKFIVRDDFDANQLLHRLVFYDDGLYFRGFNNLAGENLAFLNLEYRIRLFEMRFEDYAQELNLPAKSEKLLRKASYFADAFVFADNGLYFGRAWTGKSEWEWIPIQSVSLSQDLFSSVGVGGKIVYPRLGYVASAGITLYQRKQGLEEAYFSRLFGNVSMAF